MTINSDNLILKKLCTNLNSMHNSPEPSDKTIFSMRSILFRINIETLDKCLFQKQQKQFYKKSFQKEHWYKQILEIKKVQIKN